jgi:hypothetical protein
VNAKHLAEAGKIVKAGLLSKRLGYAISGTSSAVAISLDQRPADVCFRPNSGRRAPSRKLGIGMGGGPVGGWRDPNVGAEVADGLRSADNLFGG